MTAQGRIIQLKGEIGQLQNQIGNCHHDWDNAKYDPETQQEEYLTGEYETNGVHHHALSAFRPKIVDRWSRTCKICGFIEYTYKKAPVNYSPVFN